MALITCPECGRRFSEYAPHCPDCFIPMEMIKKLLAEAEAPESSEPIKPISEPAASRPSVPLADFGGKRIKCVFCGTEYMLSDGRCPECKVPALFLTSTTEDKVQYTMKGLDGAIDKILSSESIKYADKTAELHSLLERFIRQGQLDPADAVKKFESVEARPFYEHLIIEYVKERRLSFNAAVDLIDSASFEDTYKCSTLQSLLRGLTLDRIISLEEAIEAAKSASFDDDVFIAITCDEVMKRSLEKSVIGPDEAVNTYKSLIEEGYQGALSFKYFFDSLIEKRNYPVEKAIEIMKSIKTSDASKAHLLLYALIGYIENGYITADKATEEFRSLDIEETNYKKYYTRRWEEEMKKLRIENHE